LNFAQGTSTATTTTATMPRSRALAAAVGALALGSAAALSNSPGAPGPHATKSFTTGDNLVWMPSDLADGERAPGIVFDHGLCGAVPVYEPLLEHLASYGMVVIANRDQVRPRVPPAPSPPRAVMRR